MKGVSRVKSLDLILEMGGKTLPETEKKKFLEAKNQQYLELIADMNEEELLPGIKDLLLILKEANTPFDLGSASKNAKKILDTLNINDWFTAIVDGNDVHKGKPDPEVFLTAAKKLGYAPENCVVIEDAQAGIKAAKNAGMKAIGIGDKDTLQQADIVLPDTSKLNLELIKTL
ncbi:MAG TPA: HAD family hydrolase [Flavobacteriales bacterium]|nr:HAD family hydrolase [Flavobacteriales bacterium]